MFFNGNVPVGLDLRHLLVPLTDPRVVCQDFIDYCLGIEPQRFQILLPNFGNNPRSVPLFSSLQSEWIIMPYEFDWRRYHTRELFIYSALQPTVPVRSLRLRVIVRGESK